MKSNIKYFVYFSLQLEADDRLDKIVFTLDNLYQKTVSLEDEILQLGGELIYIPEGTINFSTSIRRRKSLEKRKNISTRRKTIAISTLF